MTSIETFARALDKTCNKHLKEFQEENPCYVNPIVSKKYSFDKIYDDEIIAHVTSDNAHFSNLVIHITLDEVKENMRFSLKEFLIRNL